ncbi:MAG: hypothetical protein WBC55_07070 [Dehalococcoidia bacterium]
MAKKVWTFVVKEQRHVVELEHGYWSGKRDIVIDGVPFESSSKIYDTGSVHHFNISGVPCILRIKSKLITFDCELYVGGTKVKASK